MDKLKTYGIYIFSFQMLSFPEYGRVIKFKRKHRIIWKLHK